MNLLKFILVPLIIFTFLYSESNAQDLTFFTDQSLFNDSCTIPLNFEDFEDTIAAPNQGTGCTSPLNSSTNNQCYTPDALIPGFSITAIEQNPRVNALAVQVPVIGVNPNIPNVAVGALFFVDDTEITFTEEVRGVGLEIIALLNNKTVIVQVFGQGGVLLGQTNVNNTTTNGTFLGILSQDAITRIVLQEAGGTNSGEYLLELSFGPCFELPVSAVPTLSEWGLIATAGILGIIGFIIIRRRKATA